MRYELECRVKLAHEVYEWALLNLSEESDQEIILDYFDCIFIAEQELDDFDLDATESLATRGYN